MKIKISKSQWESMGKKAGWKWQNPKLKNLPPLGEYTGEGEHDNPITDQELDLRRREAQRLTQQFLKSINPTIVMLAQRFYASEGGIANEKDDGFLNVKEEMLQYIVEELEKEIAKI